MRCSGERTAGGLEETLDLWNRDALPPSPERRGLGAERWER